ncbi:D-glycero-alpha-D-manno-heptose-1,7-bisphosphate 7-phosphatase [Candidatus Cloacimonas acidaminovorans]|uniref:D,D-heptose 1,7-bisphosphate phosphatase n=1 Tax=Cloacimonas acidaminovorans (strain Evry) TaxID=459349 RepID=B0VI63_CLOAI|nr:HAD family hydrolase [Candidatus Cloacimonas acidaminovorans]NLM89657.1 HAD family hydrolase [Candidatus Cloacimonadota bacterium]CAO81039.1 D,D-heptose 1,7-bisphosphate phosphatase [Candidatus Cloacimonas acidaminovorans str. Evry]HPV00110.1 HAD family hydrolase [Candidatus Cloacimonas acidaminovorans]
MTAKDIKRAIFLDRDGVISPDDFGYLSNPEEYHLYPYTIEALKIFKELNFLLFVVTNQSGIARGYFTIDDLEKVLAKMRSLLSAGGIELDGVYYSPYYKDGIVPPYNIDHIDRKPGIGMFKKAYSEFHFQIEGSYMIGDRISDLGFGRNAHLKNILLLTGNGEKDFMKILETDDLRPDFVCENLLTAAKLIRDYKL